MKKSEIRKKHPSNPRAALDNQVNEELQVGAMVFENSFEGILVTDGQGTIQRVNPAFTKITGYTGEEAIGANPRMLKSDRYDGKFYEKMWERILTQGYWKGEIWNRRKNGEAYPEWLTIAAIKDQTGKTTHYVSVFYDITEIKKREDTIWHQSYHDALTGLPNRLLFNDRLEHALTQARRSKQKICVMFLDIDYFKKINDSLGHHAGDLLLQEVSARLSQSIREEDTLSRSGGDEFLLLLEKIDYDHYIIEVVNRIKEVLSKPFIIHKQEIYVTGSVGITLFPGDGDDSETLIRNADMAMYLAKEKGRDNYQLFTPEMNKKAEKRIQLETSLRKALERREFVMYYQPKVNLNTGKTEGMEALIRWIRPGAGVVPPAEFIPVAEEMGLITAIGRFALESACKQTRAWLDRGLGPLVVSVNLSVRQIEFEGLYEVITAALDETGLPAANLCLEITEGLVMQDVESAITLFRRLRTRGIRISIDDFGTGHSSLNYLKRFPLDELKIDRSFMLDIPRDPDASAIAELIISIARTLRLKVVAEGVEDRHQLEFLKTRKCDEVQGYLFSRPLSVEGFTRYLEEERKEKLETGN